MKVEFEIQTKPESNVTEYYAGSYTDILNLEEVQAIRDAIQEHLLFIGMDNRNNVRDIRILGIGSGNLIYIDSKEIVRTALLTASEKVVLVHNHPSNSIKPSKADLHLTNYTSKILEAFKIRLVDHVIVTNKESYSMVKDNQINYDFSDDKLEFIESTFLREENVKLKEKINRLMDKIPKSKNKDCR